MKNIILALGFLILVSTCTINSIYTPRPAGTTKRLGLSASTGILAELEHEMEEILDI